MKLPPMTEVKSSQIARLGRAGADLFVQFKSGGVYKYPGAGHLCAEGIKDQSVGSWFHREIKGRYKHEGPLQ